MKKEQPYHFFLVKNLIQSLASPGLILASRWFTLLPNVSAVGAYGFFGQNFVGFYLVIAAYDWLTSGFYSGFIFTYLGFLGYFVLGRLARSLFKRNANAKLSLILMPLASFWFFLVSNFGVWLFWYPPTWQGLISCYLAAVPFYRNTLLGDMFFTGLVLGWKYVCSRDLSSLSHKLPFISHFSQHVIKR
jgi:hypothetical protein